MFATCVLLRYPFGTQLPLLFRRQGLLFLLVQICSGLVGLGGMVGRKEVYGVPYVWV